MYILNKQFNFQFYVSKLKQYQFKYMKYLFQFYLKNNELSENQLVQKLVYLNFPLKCSFTYFFLSP